jgi:hypothetical protein
MTRSHEQPVRIAAAAGGKRIATRMMRTAPQLVLAGESGRAFIGGAGRTVRGADHGGGCEVRRRQTVSPARGIQ